MIFYIAVYENYQWEITAFPIWVDEPKEEWDLLTLAAKERGEVEDELKTGGVSFYGPFPIPA
jgi:hypothetical protein